MTDKKEESNKKTTGHQRCNQCVCYTAPFDLDNLEMLEFSCMKGLPEDEYCEHFQSAAEMTIKAIEAEMYDLDDTIDKAVELIREALPFLSPELRKQADEWLQEADWEETCPQIPQKKDQPN